MLSRIVRAVDDPQDLKHDSLIEMARRLNGAGHTTKHWLSSRDRWHGGKPLTPKYIYRVLTNPLYIGKITHKDKVWPGQHKPIVPQKLWDRVQQAINTQQRQARHRWEHPHLLKGKLRTYEDFAMSPSAVHRPSKVKGEKRLVRYYVSQKAMAQGYKHCAIKTINAGYVDDLVRALVFDQLRTESLDHLQRRPSEVRDFWLREIISEVVLSPDQVKIELRAEQVEACKAVDWPDADDVVSSTCVYQPMVEQRHGNAVLTLALQIKRLDGKRVLLSPEGQDLIMPVEPEPKDHIVAAIGNAYRWRDLMARENLTLGQLAKRLGVSESRIRKYLPLINLSPAILKRALTGHLPTSVTMLSLLAAARHLNWERQAQFLGLDLVQRTHLIPVKSS